MCDYTGWIARSAAGHDKGTLLCVAPGQVGGKEDSQDGGRDPDGWAGLSAAFFLYTCSVHENSPSCPTQPKNPRTGQIISDYIIASYVSECNYRTVTVDRPNFPGFPQF